MLYPIVIAALTAYLLGNLNGSVCVSAIVADDDVRKHGSGNAGLTNFIRSYGVGKAIYVILIDAGKAVIACLASGLLLEHMGWYMEGKVLGGLMVMLGHICPALLGGKGGKGILSGLFIAVVIDWRIALLILVVFALAYLATGYVSLGSVLAAVAFIVGFIVLHRDDLLVMLGGIVMGLLALVMHRENIRRLLKGQERKTNLFSNKQK